MAVMEQPRHFLRIFFHNKDGYGHSRQTLASDRRPRYSNLSTTANCNRENKHTVHISIVLARFLLETHDWATDFIREAIIG